MVLKLELYLYSGTQYNTLVYTLQYKININDMFYRF